MDNGFELRRRIMLKNAWVGIQKIIVTGANGIVSFVTKIFRPTKITCDFSPVQDLHGMPYPYPAGASVNLIPDGTDTTNGYVAESYLDADGTTVIDAYLYVSEYFPITAGETYTWSGPASAVSSSICFYDSSKVFISGIAAEQLLPKTFTAPANSAYCRATQYIEFEGDSNSFQIQTGSTATTPRRRYSNICPITGWTGCNVYQRGANFIVPDNPSSPAANYSHTSSGTIKYSSEYGAFYSDGAGIGEARHSGTNQRFFIAPKDMTVTFSVDVYLVNTPYGIRFYKNGPRITDIRGTANQWYHYTYTTTMNKGDYFSLALYSGIYWKNLQVVSGSTDLPYSEYQGNTLAVDWEDDAGTVYGGTLTVNEDGTGTLVSEWAKVTLKNLTVSSFSTNDNSSAARFAIPGAIYGDSSYKVPAMSSAISAQSSQYNGYAETRLMTWLGTITGTEGYAISGERLCAGTKELKNATIEIFLAYAGDWEIAYELGTPVTYTLTASKVNSIIGTNNIWHDMNGAITVEYYNKP